MNNEDLTNKLKEILTNMNASETQLDSFYEVMEKETGGKLTFSSFKVYLDRHYSNVNKLDRIFLLKQISIEPSGKINLTELFNYFSKILHQTISSPILAFYNIASIIEGKLKISTLEFIYKNGLSLEDEININDFYVKVSENLKIDDITTIIVFKGLDCDKKGKIRVEDFVIVIDSYREDRHSDQTNSKSKQNENEIVKLIIDINYLKSKLEDEAISVEEVYTTTNLGESGKFYEVYNNIKFLIKDVNTDNVENVLNFLKKEETKVYKKDFENLMNIEAIDPNYIVNFIKSKNKVLSYNKFTLNDMQVFWVNKLCALLDNISVTPLMAFQTAANDKQAKEMNLDNFKRKLQKMIPASRVSAVELNNIADSLDINKNKIILLDDYNEIIEGAKNDPKFSVVMKPSDGLLGGTNVLINSFVKTRRNNNDLPIKGNTKALSILKTDLSKTHVNSPPDKKDTLFKSDNNFMKGTKLSNTKSDKIEKDKSLQQTNLKEIQSDPIQEFIKELAVFENGDWSLIELLEELNMNEKGFIPTFDLNNLLIKKFNPTIQKSKIFTVVRKIDCDQDGFVHNLDLISFLFNFFKHRSTKIALKEIARKIEFEEKLSTEDFFSRKFLQPNSEINFVNFIQFLLKNFEIEPPVVKKIYDELKKILTNKSSICVSDMIDLINEYRVDNLRMKDRKMNKDYTSISLLDKKYYEEEMRGFVRFLQKGFGFNSFFLKENLEHFLNLPATMKLSQFRDMFIKPLTMDYSLGVATFQLLKSFSNKEATVILKEDLFNLIDSYLDPVETALDPEVIVTMIENKHAPVKYCFEAIPYSYKGITVLDIVRVLEMFYPQMSRRIMMNLTKGIDDNQMGMVTFKNLSHFLYKTSKRDAFSNDLMIKYLASIVDYKNIDTREFIAAELKLKKSDKIVQFSEHNEFINNKLKFEYEQSENLFLFLSNNCAFSGYILDRLIRLINVHRQNKIGTIKSAVYDNSSQVEAIKAQSVEFTDFLRTLNDNINLSEPFSKLCVGDQMRIAVYDIFLAFSNTYQNLLDLDKKLLIKLLRTIDKDKKGSVEYETLINTVKNFLDEFETSILLHCKYLSVKLLKEYEGKWRDYLNYKGLIPNKFITRDQFENLFKEECLNNEYISFNLFEFLKEKKGSNANFLFIQNFVDYISGLSKNIKTSSVIMKKKMTEEEIEDHIKTTIYRIEKDDNKKFSTIFDKINLREVNQFGKINSEVMKAVLSELFNLDEFAIELFINYFSKLVTLFDLLKLVDFIQNTSEKSAVLLEEIAQKSKLKIPSDLTLNDFKKKFNLNLYQPLSLVESCSLFNPIFEFSNYECFFLFKEIVSNDTNSLKDSYKLNFDFILQHFSLYKLFKKDNKKKEVKLEPKLLNAVRKLVIYLDSLSNKMQIFKQFDSDSNGVLDRNEFLSLLKSCKGLGLNESQMIIILNFVDNNNDNYINYIEFIDFLNSIRPELGDLNAEVNEKKEEASTKIEEEKNKTSKAKTKPVPKLSKSIMSQVSLAPTVPSKLDSEKLKINYEFNLKNINTSAENPFNLILFSIQEHLFNKIGQPDSLEVQLMKMGIANKETLPKEEFFAHLSQLESLNDKIDEEIEEKLWNFSMEGFIKKVKNTLILENLVNYRHFLNNILNFKVKSQTQNIKYSPKKNKSETSTPRIVEKKKTVKFSLGGTKLEEQLMNIISFTITNKDFNLNVNRVDEIDKIQNSLKHIFTFGKGSKDDKQIDNKFKNNFQNFLQKVADLPYEGYDYKINPETDYFKRPNGSRVETILNNEDAAIKKCEDIYRAIKEGESFLDRDFGSLLEDKGQSNRMSLYFNGKPPKGNLDPSLIEWYRMEEICEEDPVFIDEGADANDVCQGAIGNCWFISALSVLATKDHLLRGELNTNIFDDGELDEEECLMLSTGVYPPIFQCFRIKGVYCFRFYKNFEWKYVIVDDRLPCRKVFDKMQPKKLLYGKCKNEIEFWVPLIEKAYAKLHGCYEALVSGFIDDGLVDLTGLVARKIMVESQHFATLEVVNRFWEMLVIHSQKTLDLVKDKKDRKLKALILTTNNTMMGCSIDAKVVESEVVFNDHKSGILAGHAYAILDVFQIPKPTSLKERKVSRLLRIRNPWGYKEWNGKWSDESLEMQKNRPIIQQTLNKLYEGSDEKIDLDAEDGTFLMCYSDFRKLFNKLFICVDFPESYVGITFYDAWSKEESGGLPINNSEEEMINWANNPQYYLSLKKTSTVMISLMQNDGRLTASRFPYADTTRKTCLVISKTVGKQKLASFDNDKIVTISPVRQHRENSIYQTLPKGEYIISVCTLKPGETGAFCLEIHFEDSYLDYNYNEDNFIEKLQNTRIERLGDSPNKVRIKLKKETTVEELKEVNEKKKVFIYRQFKNILAGLEQKPKPVDVAPKNDNSRKSKMKRQSRAEEKDEFDNF